MALRHLKEAVRMGCDEAEEQLKKLIATDPEKHRIGER